MLKKINKIRSQKKSKKSGAEKDKEKYSNEVVDKIKAIRC